MSRDELTAKIEQMALLPADHKFRGATWLSPLFNTFWTSPSQGAAWFDDYGPMARFLYDIGFLGIGKAHELRPTYVYDDELLAEAPDSFSESSYFDVHPSFRTAID